MISCSNRSHQRRQHSLAGVNKGCEKNFFNVVKYSELEKTRIHADRWGGRGSSIACGNLNLLEYFISGERFYACFVLFYLKYLQFQIFRISGRVLKQTNHYCFQSYKM